MTRAGIFDGLEPPYATLVIDPPWPYPVTDRFAGKGRTPSPHARYARMTMADLTDLPVAALADDSAHLWMWITSARLLTGDHRPLLDAWGFEAITICTWVKTGRYGLGRYLRGSTEHVIFARKGWGTVPDVAYKASHFEAPRGRHSVKPDCFLDLVEQVSPPRYVELFARTPRLGWDSFGAGFELEEAAG